MRRLTVAVLDTAYYFRRDKSSTARRRSCSPLLDGTSSTERRRSCTVDVFHVCWTAGRTDKLRYLKNMALWFLEPKCDQDSWEGP